MSNNKVKHDPLEAAKITADTMKVDDQKSQQTKWPAAPPPTAKPTPASAQSSAEPVVASVTVTSTVAAPVGPGPKRYRSLSAKKFSWNGSVTTMPAGEIVDELGYGGAAGIARLREAGLELEEIK